jgi:hypothetical protein
MEEKWEIPGKEERRKVRNCEGKNTGRKERRETVRKAKVIDKRRRGKRQRQGRIKLRKR